MLATEVIENVNVFRIHNFPFNLLWQHVQVQNFETRIQFVQIHAGISKPAERGFDKEKNLWCSLERLHVDFLEVLKVNPRPLESLYSCERSNLQQIKLKYQCIDGRNVPWRDWVWYLRSDTISRPEGVCLETHHLFLAPKQLIRLWCLVVHTVEISWY